MKCQNCGAELNIDGSCPNCAQGKVREMGRSEKDSYVGVTIDADSNRQYDQEYSYRNQRPWGGSNQDYSGRRGPRIITFSTGGGLMKKLLLGLIIAAVLSVLLFAVLPIFVIAVIIGAVIYAPYAFLF